VDIINISGGEFSSSGTAHPLLADAISKCAEEGILVVAAAGNQGCECLHIPGALPTVLAVGAMNSAGEPMEFSNWGGSYRGGGILAPGADIPVAEPGGGIAPRSGTSYATPIVSGVAALLLHLARSRGIEIRPQDIRDILLKTALDCTHQEVPECHRLLAGRLNIEGAVRLLLTRGERPMSERTWQKPSPDLVFTPSDSEWPLCEIPAMPNGTPAASIVPSGIDPSESGAIAREQPAFVDQSTTDPSRELHLMDQTVQPTDSAACVASVTQSHLIPSDTAVGMTSRPTPPQLVFALGKLSFDYGTRQRRDFFFNDMKKLLGGTPSVDDHGTFLGYLSKDPNKREFLTSIIWTLKIEETSIYAIKPADAFAREIHNTLQGFLIEQIGGENKGPFKTLGSMGEIVDKSGEDVEMISVSGFIAGQTRLLTGETVPIIVPDSRGLYSWTLEGLIHRVFKELSDAGAKVTEKDLRIKLTVFFERVYYQLRNLGLTPQERALNFAATDALRAGKVFEDVLGDPQYSSFELDNIEVVRSRICPPDSDCYDVELKFFNPQNTLFSARVFRLTVDVSDVMPVSLGAVRSWSTR